MLQLPHFIVAYLLLSVYVILLYCIYMFIFFITIIFLIPITHTFYQLLPATITLSYKIKTRSSAYIENVIVSCQHSTTTTICHLLLRSYCTPLLSSYVAKLRIPTYNIRTRQNTCCHMLPNFLYLSSSLILSLQNK